MDYVIYCAVGLQRTRAACLQPKDVLVLPFDLMDSTEKLQAVAKVADEAFGSAGIDFLIHNAGRCAKDMRAAPAVCCLLCCTVLYCTVLFRGSGRYLNIVWEPVAAYGVMYICMRHRTQGCSLQDVSRAQAQHCKHTT
jgi:hypothetical protein